MDIVGKMLEEFKKETLHEILSTNAQLANLPELNSIIETLLTKGRIIIPSNTEWVNYMSGFDFLKFESADEVFRKENIEGSVGIRFNLNDFKNNADFKRLRTNMLNFLSVEIDGLERKLVSYRKLLSILSRA